MAATQVMFDVCNWSAFVRGTLMGPDAFGHVILELRHADTQQLVVCLPESLCNRGGTSSHLLSDMVAWVVSGTIPGPPLDLGELLEHAGAWRRMTGFVGADYLAYPHVASALQFRLALPPVFAKSAHANVLRRTGAFRHPGAVTDPYAGLVEIYGDEECREEDEEDYGTRGGFVYGCGALRPAAPYAPPSRPFADPRIEAGIHALFDGTQWFGESKTCAGLVLAGGFVVALAHGKVALASEDAPSGLMRPPGDIDCFVVVSGVGRTKAQIDAAADGVLASTLAALGRNVGRLRGGRLAVEHTGRLVNVSVLVPHGALLKIQIVRCIYETPAHVVWGFDVDACGMLYDGVSFMATTDAARTLRTGVVLFDQTKMSATGLFRYTKYIERYGMRAFVPGVPQRVLDAAIVLAYASPLVLPAWVRVRPGRRTGRDDPEARVAVRAAVAADYAALYPGAPIPVLLQQKEATQPVPAPTGVFGLLLAVARRRLGSSTVDAAPTDYSDAQVEHWWQGLAGQLAKWTRRGDHAYPWISKLDAVQRTFSGAFNPIDVNVYADFCDPALLTALLEVEIDETGRPAGPAGTFAATTSDPVVHPARRTRRHPRPLRGWRRFLRDCCWGADKFFCSLCSNERV
jgi:hypothetical protein